MAKRQVELSLDQALMRLAGHDKDKSEREIASLKKKLAYAQDELRDLRPKAKKLVEQQDLDRKVKDFRRNAEIVAREAGRVIRLTAGLQKRTIGGMINQNRWGTPSDLISARKKLLRAAKRLK